MSYYVYILQCADKSYYTGVTNDIERRVSEHKNPEYRCYTSSRLPVKLVYYEEFSYIRDAIDAEKQIKGWRREKKEALIRKNYDSLTKLAKKKF
jgi:putative endonuclease